MKINITQEHINNGRRADCDNCPIALALKEQFERATVRSFVRTWDGDKRRNFLLTSKAVSFITDFDNGRPVEPCELEIYEDHSR
jgi:hypothetical protein